MDKYLTYPGKQPVYLGDIDFMQSAVRDSMKRLLQAYIGDNSGDAILLGCVFDYGVSSLAWTDGIVCIDGEILPIAAGSLLGTGGAYFEIISTPSGTRTFGDGDSHDCFEVRAATISHTDTGHEVSAFRRIAPRDTLFAKVFGFATIVNSTSKYARLAFCGGAFHLSLRRPAMSESSTTVFDAITESLPDALLELFQQDGAPTSMGVAINSSAAVPVIATLTWSISGDKLALTITASSAVTLGEWTLDVTLPVF